MEVSQEVWNEGRAAYANGGKEIDCPYDMGSQWSEWADWTCGYGQASHEDFWKRLDDEARGVDDASTP
ncbi:hypothetical protein [Rhizobium lentis]|uniref:Uncharacterized protein n=1 Tax=Rhizobium lentis TaxID=1138194 RepID=A0ABS7IBU5_9HYPH|nr:hypothetical protein [Rhizobium lentis]MBX5089362.1 hypothetical protein [Rhizobium lentis]